MKNIVIPPLNIWHLCYIKWPWCVSQDICDSAAEDKTWKVGTLCCSLAFCPDKVYCSWSQSHWIHTSAYSKLASLRTFAFCISYWHDYSLYGSWPVQKCLKCAVFWYTLMIFMCCTLGMFMPYIWACKAAGVGATNTGISTGKWCSRALISACWGCWRPLWRAPLNSFCSSALWSRPVRFCPCRVSHSSNNAYD